MPERLVYANHHKRVNDWDFKLLINSIVSNLLKKQSTFSFDFINRDSELNLDFFEQSFFDSQGIQYKRIIFVDYGTLKSFSELDVSNRLRGSYCEIGALTPFNGVNPVNGSIISSMMVSNLGLDAGSGKYLDDKYQKSFSVTLVPYNTWYAQQFNMMAWSQYQSQLAMYDLAPASTVIVDQEQQYEEQQEEQANEDDQASDRVPVVEQEEPKDVPSSGRATRRFSFSLPYSSSTVTLHSDEDDPGYNSEDLIFVSGFRRSASKHSFSRLIPVLVPQSWDIKTEEYVPVLVMDDLPAAAQHEVISEVIPDDAEAVVDLVKPQEKIKQDDSNIVTEPEHTEDAFFTPVKSRKGNPKRLFRAPANPVVAPPPAKFSMPVYYDSSSDESEPEVVSSVPVAVIKVESKRKKPKAKQKKPDPIVKEPSKAERKPVAAIVKPKPVTTVVEHQPKALVFSKTTTAVQSSPKTSTDAVSAILSRRAISLYRSITSAELSQEQAVRIARTCIGYFIASMQDEEMFQAPINHNPRAVLKLLFFFLQCIIAGFVLDVVVQYKNRLDQRPRHRIS